MLLVLVTAIAVFWYLQMARLMLTDTSYLLPLAIIYHALLQRKLNPILPHFALVRAPAVGKEAAGRPYKAWYSFKPHCATRR